MSNQAFDARIGRLVDLPYVPSPNDDGPHDAPVPASISPFQARAALLSEGLLDAAEAAVSGAGPAAAIAWEYATEWRRDSPTIASIGDALGLTAIQIDDLFRYAATIRA